MLIAARRRLGSYRAALGVFVLAGVLMALVGTACFAAVAQWVRAGDSLRFDVAVLEFFGRHRIPWLEATLVEITVLGTGTTVFMVAGVAALFLSLTRHRYSGALLLASTIGGLLLNAVLKLGFDRPRPQVFTWATHVASTSFPSGHAMSAAIVYGTLAYLAARLQSSRIARAMTLSAAALLIALIGLSRMYLGVHYPSDVLAGIVVGLAWAGFCMALLEATQLYARHIEPGIRQDERDAAAEG